MSSENLRKLKVKFYGLFPLQKMPFAIKVFRDDFKFTEGIEDKDKREFIQEFVGQMFNDLKEHRYLEAWAFDLNDIYHPQIYYLKSLDLAGRKKADN